MEEDVHIVTRELKVAPLDRMEKFFLNPLTLVLFVLAGLRWWVLTLPFAPRSYLVSPGGVTIRAPVTSYPKARLSVSR